MDDPRTDTWTVHCDGSAVPNPGRMAVGAVIVAPDGSRSTLSRGSTEIGCNNEAELMALSVVLQELRLRGALHVRVFTDNAVLVEQLGEKPAKGGGKKSAPIERLAVPFDAVRRSMAEDFRSVVLGWIPRHRNGEADALARAAQGLAPKAAPKIKARRRNG
jgi:ribonuclease HI